MSAGDTTVIGKVVVRYEVGLLASGESLAVKLRNRIITRGEIVGSVGEGMKCIEKWRAEDNKGRCS